MEILLETLNDLEKNIQKLSVVDKEKYSYFQQRIQEIRAALTELDVNKSATLQHEIDKTIIDINKLKMEFSNYMKTGSLEKAPGKLFFDLPEEENSDISGNEKIKRHRLGLLSSTVELVKKDVELDFSKIEQAITKFNSEKNNTDPEYSPAEIAYIDRLIAELFIEYQRKYYQKNGTLPLEEPSTYCNMKTYESVLRVMASEKLIEEKERIGKLESLILDGQVVNNNEIWNMLSKGEKDKEMAIATLGSLGIQNESGQNQLIPLKSGRKINDLILSIRKKNIFGRLVEKTKKIKLDVNGFINIPEEMKVSIIRAIIPEGIRQVSNGAFCDCINLSDVSIPESVTEIGTKAFQSCSSLTDIKLPSNLTYLGNECFKCSGLQNIEIPKKVLEVGYGAFYSCTSLRQALLHEGLKRIGKEAFANTSIEEIKIPDSVEVMGDNSFRCNYLDEISLPKKLEDANIDSICGKNTPKCIIRGQEIVANTDENSRNLKEIDDREKD